MPYPFSFDNAVSAPLTERPEVVVRTGSENTGAEMWEANLTGASPLLSFPPQAAREAAEAKKYFTELQKNM